MQAAPQSVPAPQVLLSKDGALATLTLNRPEVMNALSLDMVRLLTTHIDQLEADPAIGYVALRGAGERGLCAGGDIRTLYQSCITPDGWPETFWSEEYALNAHIASYPKPYIAFMDGVVMGGGMGVSAHARVRIVTERTKIAMPEVGIGLVPDVGGTWLLSRSPGDVGTCLALTGMTIGAADAIYARLAGTFVASGKLNGFAKELATLRASAGSSAVENALLAYADEPGPSVLEKHRALIDACFAFDTVEDIAAALAKSNDPFAADVLTTIRTKSPTSLKVALKLLRLARTSKTLEDCLEREFTAVMRAAEHPDLREGIRASVIDKDRKPKWQPAGLEDVSAGDVASFFVRKTSRTIPFHNRETPQ